MKFQLKSIMNFLYVNECTVADVTKMISNYCFDENFERMKFQLKSIMNFLYVNECTVADVMKMISNYYLDKKEKRIDSDFYSYLQEVMDLDRETSEEESEGKSEEELEDSFEKDVSIVEGEVKELKADVG